MSVEVKTLYSIDGKSFENVEDYELYSKLKEVRGELQKIRDSLKNLKKSCKHNQLSKNTIKTFEPRLEETGEDEYGKTVHKGGYLLSASCEVCGANTTYREDNNVVVSIWDME